LAKAKNSSDSVEKHAMPAQKGGINNPGTISTGGGHVVGGDFFAIIHQHGATVEALFNALEERGVLQLAETVHMQRRQVIMLAERLKPRAQLNFDQAITVLARAVEIAVAAKRHHLHKDKNEDEFIDDVVAEDEADAQFAKGHEHENLRLTWFGAVLHLSHSATILLCNIMNANSKSGNVVTSITAALHSVLGSPAPVAAAVVNAIINLGPTALQASDSASRGIAIYVLWVGPPWCRSL
jgi:hypothetical protein